MSHSRAGRDAQSKRKTILLCFGGSTESLSATHWARSLHCPRFTRDRPCTELAGW
jgi:hypothetical protein